MKTKNMLSKEIKIEEEQNIVSPPCSEDSLMRQKVLESLRLCLVLKQKREEREKRAREKQERIELVLRSVLEKHVIGTSSESIRKRAAAISLIDAQTSINSIPQAVLNELRNDAARVRLKAMASRRSTEDPTLSEAQIEIVKRIEYADVRQLYRREKDDHDPLLHQYEKQARNKLLSDLAHQTTKKEYTEILAQKLYLRELSWLRKEIGATLDVIAGIAPNTSPEQQNLLAINIVHAPYEMRMKQSGDPVNPSEIRRLIAESLILRKPLRIVIIKCLAHDYCSGAQEVVSIYDKEGILRKQERQFLNQILGYQRILTDLGIPNEIIVAVADTDIPYQREEPIKSKKWQDAQTQIEETKKLYRQHGLSVLSLMQTIKKAGLREKHDEVYREVKQKPLVYIPSIYLERRINKRYEKYLPLEGMTRNQARKIVINSYAEEAALGEIWDLLWEDCIHLVYKTTYLAAAMEVCRNPKNKLENNIPTIFSSGQGRIDSDGLEYDQ